MAAALAALVALGGCTVSPQPEPLPLDPRFVRLDPCSGAGCDGPFFTIIGDPGAVPGGAGVIWVVNLDLTAAPTVQAVEADGSFRVELEGAPFQELRLQLRVGDERDAPYDVVGDPEAGVIRLSQRALAGCLIVMPAAELELAPATVGSSSRSSISVANQCAADIVIERVALRVPAPFAIEGVTTPLTLRAAETAQIDVTFAPVSVGRAEEILFVEASAPAMDRRPITIIAEGVE